MRFLILSAVVFAAVLGACGSPTSGGCDSGTCADGGVVINELAGTGGDFVELFNASDVDVDLSGYGLADFDADAGVIRYPTSLRFPTGTSIAARKHFTIFLEVDCPTTVTPCLRGEFGIGQSSGDTLTLLDGQNNTVTQQAYPANAAASGSSWARVYDGAPSFEVQRRSPGAANAP
ncbi:MAG: lamin tail domain-containing protein [Myxococcota bacterium]